MRIHRNAALLLLCSNMAIASATHAQCPPQGQTVRSLQELQAARFAVEPAQSRNGLALALLECLGHPNPVLRDDIAFGAISHWLRAKQLSLSSREQLRVELLTRLGTPAPSTDPGFKRPFAALVLSEVIRADRIEPNWDKSTLQQVLEAALSYLGSVDDWRGFDEREGWRHGVAHGADVLLQLAAHPGTDAADHRRILDMLAIKLRPSQTHFYIYGEPGRLARPALLIAQRKTLQVADWTPWLEKISQAPAGSSWAEGFKSQSALAQRHNVSSFLHALLVGSHAIQDPALTAQVLEQLAKL